MEQELSNILGGRKVDLNTPKCLSKYFRDKVVATAEVQYAGPCVPHLRCDTAQHKPKLPFVEHKRCYLIFLLPLLDCSLRLSTNPPL
jgi:hypothetical protein